MVTARRSTDVISSAYEPAVGGIDVLERPRNYEQANVQPAVKTDYSEEEARRRNNLDKLLNYDRYTEQVADVAQTVADVVIEKNNINDEDIRPTSTTMQFGEDIDQITKEMNRKETESQEGYQFTKKGKVAVMLYALVVTVILALIVLNTGVLATLSNQSAQKAEQLNATIEKYDALQQEIASITDSDYILDVAQNQYGMVKGN